MTRLVLPSLFQRSKVILFESGDQAGTLSYQPLGGVGDLTNMASVGVHREERPLGLLGIEVAAKDDLTVPGRIPALVLIVFVIATGEHRKSHGYHR
jgi:hypothetical protein